MPITFDSCTISGNETFIKGNVDGISLQGAKIETRETGILDILATCGFANSKSEARRMIAQGAVSLRGDTLYSSELTFAVGDTLPLKAGQNKDATVVIVKETQ